MIEAPLSGIRGVLQEDLQEDLPTVSVMMIEVDLMAGGDMMIAEEVTTVDHLLISSGDEDHPDAVVEKTTTTT